ncbi:MAG: NAD(P)/FAD-dependent oxidoreductase [Desulfovibrionaceae bacterium]|nr:NAD(P)/FAD-dependent oxidoreductase [Desulfovibrionaceae bacterium]
MIEYETDTIVIGAGVVGLACAKVLAEAGREVVILEALDAFGAVTSARNSEVIHAGLYYAPGSLKAALCVQGRQLLYAHCLNRGVAHRRCGKLVVATTPGEIGYLEKLEATARANGVDDVRLLTAFDAKALEPALHAVAALLCPSTGIVDSHAYMLSLLGDAQAHGAQLICRSPVESGQACAAGGIELQVAGQEPVTVRAATVVNAAGLRAPDVARRIQGLPAAHVPQPVFCKGSYFTLSGKSPFSRLIYPVPEAGGLGVHLTLDLGGQARFGPDTEWLDTADAGALDYRVDARHGDGFYASIRKYWPKLPDGALEPGYSGVRPKLRAGNGEIFPDFVISGPFEHGVPGLVNLFGIESPGLTASLAIGKYVAGLV